MMMNFDRYQELAQRTSNTINVNSKLLNGSLGLSGETGEVLDMIKKHLYQGHTLSNKELELELGDVLWYIAEIATARGLKMSNIAHKNIEKLEFRYPEGFEAEKSINRKGVE